MVAGWQRMDEGAGCSADRRCRERSELEGVMPPSDSERQKRRNRTSWGVSLVFIRQIAMGRRPITFAHIFSRDTPQEGRALKSPLLTPLFRV